MPKLFIAIDPGFDSIKVVANEQVFKFPFNVVETDERKMHDFNVRGDFLLYKDEIGITSRVGQYARELVFERKEQLAESSSMEDFYTEQRFTSGSFKIGLRAAIALAFEKTGLPQNSEIFLMITLPHALRSKYTPSVVGAAAGVHHFYLRVGSTAEKEFRFTIQEGNIYTVSQALAAILGETSDIKGNINRQKLFYLSNGPTLVLDGGYYTMGIVELSAGGSVDDAKTESDTQHAMRNINAAVAEEIKKVRPDVQHYVIEYLISQNNGMIRYMDKDHAVTMDLKQLRKKKAQAICADFINYLNQKYNNLLDINYVLVTGGTGTCFYSQMQKYYEKIGIMDGSHMLLSSSELNNVAHPIEFAIAIGGYKGLRGKVKTAG